MRHTYTLAERSLYGEWTQNRPDDPPDPCPAAATAGAAACDRHSAGLVRRARIILLLADQMTITDIAAKVGISRRHVYKWVQRFVEEGVEGLTDKPGRGRQSIPRPGALTDAHGIGQESVAF
jgi:hypothetical protein